VNGSGTGAGPGADGAADGDVGAELARLERAMWDVGTRSDPVWMDAHLAADFLELGRSGRCWSRDEVIAERPDAIACRIEDLDVRFLVAEVALVTYRSIEPRGDALRTSVWRYDALSWRLVHHQATPTEVTPTT
jgi:ribonuclease HI